MRWRARKGYPRVKSLLVRSAVTCSGVDSGCFARETLKDTRQSGLGELTDADVFRIDEMEDAEYQRYLLDKVRNGLERADTAGSIRKTPRHGSRNGLSSRPNRHRSSGLEGSATLWDRFI